MGFGHQILAYGKRVARSWSPASARRILRAWVPLFVLAFLGCGQSRPADRDRSTMGNPNNVENNALETIFIEYDPGIIRPGSKTICPFSISNASDSEWTLKAIHTNCACTVPSVSTETFEPGKAGQIVVHFRAPPECGDMTKGVDVEFNESGAPVIRLLVRAKVRAPLTCFPPKLEFGELSRGAVVQQSISAQNFSDNDWASLCVDTTPHWLRANALLSVIGESEIRPRQCWNITTTVDSTSLPPGIHEGIVTIRDSLSQHTSIIPVYLRVLPPVRVSPTALFYGRVYPGKASSKRVVVEFTQTTVPRSASEIEMTHDLGECLVLRWTATEGLTWSLDAIFTADSHDSFVAGTVEIKFPGDEFVKLAIPVHGMVIVAGMMDRGEH